MRNKDIIKHIDPGNHTINVYCQHAKYLLFVNRSFTKGSTKKNEYKEISF